MRRVTAVAVIHRHPPDGIDKYGNPLTVPVSQWPTEELPLYSIQPERTEEDFAGGRQAVARGVRLSAPLSAPIPGVDDLITLPGQVGQDGPFHVVGEVERWETNPILPFTRHGGMVIRVRRQRR